MSGLPILRQVTDRETGTRTYEHYGVALPSVTTVLRVLDKPGLRMWYAREAVEAAARVAEAADGAGSGTEVARAIRERATEIAGAAGRSSDAAKTRGIAIHEIVRECIAGRVPAVAREHVGYVEAFTSFLRERQARLLWSEAPVLNRRVGYAGTCDAIGIVDGVRAVLDWKTCASEAKAVVYDEHRLQLSAYRAATTMISADSDDHRMPRTESGAIVHLWPGGYRVTVVKCGTAEFRAFCGLLAVWTWMQRAKEIPMTLRPAQQRVLDVIRGYIAEHGYPPSLRDIARATGSRSATSVRRHVQALAKAGAIEIGTARARALRVIGT